MKAIMLVLKVFNVDNDVAVVGGTESMSNVPHYVEKVRTGQKLVISIKNGLVLMVMTFITKHIWAYVQRFVLKI